MMTIELTDEMQRLVASEMRSGIFKTPQDVVLAALRTLSPSEQEEMLVDSAAPAHLRVTSIAQLEKLALEGLDSPAREITDSDFERARQEIIDHHNAGGKNGSAHRS
jgi:Arc/MetJ-type ribon-helix-helix transcriptional regulator